MGLYQKLFQKRENVEVVENRTEPDIVTLNFYQALKMATEKPVTYFTLEKKKNEIFDCKIGGAYFIPKDQEIPVDKISGKPLFLLAQINFSKIEPIEHFPTKGLLQIFISGDDDVYGCDFDHPTVQSQWAIRYLDEIPEKIPDDRVFLPQANEETMLPFPNEAEYALVEHHTTQTVSINDYRFDDCFSSACKNFLKEGQNTIWDLDNDIRDSLIDKLKTFACQINGYPCFTQADPRENMSGEIPEILLFQLDTVEDIMWGDSGVANFFINENDLRRKDFSKVVYNWDCF